MSNDQNINSRLTKDSRDTQLPEHLAHLSKGQWAIWRWVGLRGAGFPVHLTLDLASPECATVADQYIAAQDMAQRAQGNALSALRDVQRQSDPDKRKALRKFERKLMKGRVPEQPVTDIQELVDAFGDANARVETATSDFHAAFQAAISQATQAIYKTARDDRFREALLWQNRRALHTGVDALLRKPPTTTRSSKQRQHEAVVVNYLQRYCTKNDTIGFFGPVGWARVVDDGAMISAQAGPTLLASRTVYFEEWCIDALARMLAEDEAIHPWFVPRLMPHLYVDGTTLIIPLSSPFRLSAAQAAVLQACDGERTAKDIVEDLVSKTGNGIENEAQVYELLREMRSRHRIAWALEFPAEGLYPERTLRQRIESIEDEPRRKGALDVLDKLETARKTVADAAGDVERLEQAMQGLETTFTHLTGAAATRRAGETYAGRSLIYEDCRRDIEVTFGSEFLASFASPLSLMLASARWYLYQASIIYRDVFRGIYDRLARKAGTRTVSLAEFWLWTHPLVFGDDERSEHTLENMLQERWSAILDVPAGHRHVEYASQDLQQRVLELFAAPHLGWASARYHSPDITIVASGVQAIQDGQYQCVLGEMHPGANTLRSSLFVLQHPAPEELLRATESDLPEPQVLFVSTRGEKGMPLRLSNALVPPKDWRFMFGYDSCGVPRSRALPTGSLVVEDVDGDLIVRTRDGRLRFDIIDIYGDLLMPRLLHCFDILPQSSYTPRISIDRLIVHRETWRFSPKEMPFAWHKDESERFLGARRWMREHKMPRFIFIKATTEQKPFYVDLASPISVNIFAKVIRRTGESDSPDASITVTEMLPAPDQTWLPDSQGQRYTCELRIVAVDMQ